MAESRDEQGNWKEMKRDTVMLSEAGDPRTTTDERPASYSRRDFFAVVCGRGPAQAEGLRFATAARQVSRHAANMSSSHASAGHAISPADLLRGAMGGNRTTKDKDKTGGTKANEQHE